MAEQRAKKNPGQPDRPREEQVTILPLGLRGMLVRPQPSCGFVLFAHGSGSSRLSPRNRQVAAQLQDAGLGTLLFDLLLDGEADDRRNVFDIPLLAERLVLATDWVRAQEGLHAVPLGYFGASTGGAAALVAETVTRHPIRAIVCRGSRPDLAGPVLPRVRAATLVIVGGEDHGIIPLNEAAFAKLTCTKELAIVPGASHLFEEPGTLDMVVALARGWFATHLRGGEGP